jgi:hypothetical protein
MTKRNAKRLKPLVLKIKNTVPTQKALFRCCSNGTLLYTITDLPGIINDGHPADPENGEDMEYVGLIANSAKIECGMFYEDESQVIVKT